MPDSKDSIPSAFWMETLQTATQDEALLKRHPSVFEMSRAGVFQLCVLEILNRDLGFELSAQTHRPVLGDGQPIPLMSYAFIEYVMGLDLSAFTVLEIGGGNSTPFWANRAKTVLTLEHDPSWYERMREQAPPNSEMKLVGVEDYAGIILALPSSFDLIVIDCNANRCVCAKAVEGKLKPGGIVVLDNSDWYPNAASVLREQGLIQIDFPDFRPDHWYRCTTSMFLHPEFRPKPRTGKLPEATLGGKDLSRENKWDQPT